MSVARESLLQRVGNKLWLTDGGLETTMVFHESLDLPYFSSFPLLDHPEGRNSLTRYFDQALETAKALGLGFVLDTTTWRASAGWGAVMNLTPDAVQRANHEAVAFSKSLCRDRPDQDILLNGIVGPHGDAYAPDSVLTADEAMAYHAPQIAILAEAGVDMVTAMTISSTGEAIGIARASQEAGLPVALSFTVETDGRLISGKSLEAAVLETDRATEGFPAWYGINCAHPEHFQRVLKGDWVQRIGVLRANASRKSHSELDESSELDAGDPDELGHQYAALQSLLPGLRVIGGCCGTDVRHIRAMGKECAHQHNAA